MKNFILRLLMPDGIQGLAFELGGLINNGKHITFCKLCLYNMYSYRKGKICTDCGEYASRAYIISVPSVCACGDGDELF